MRKILLLLGLITLCNCVLPAQTNPGTEKIIKMKAKPEKGFYWDYLLFIPDSCRHAKVNTTIFVVPNNTGISNDSIEVHEKDAINSFRYVKIIANKLYTPILIPVFPRPKTNWQIYTHALDRDVMLTDIKELNRLDLQLVKMIEDARETMEKGGIKTEQKVLMMGFSASGMFTNRFALIHPEMIKAAAIGSPGGIPMVPVKTLQGVQLRYPIGTADFETITGSPLNTAALSQIPLYFFLGDKDNNDSVVYRDSFEQEDEDLIMKYFGKTLQERWEVCKKAYEESNFRNTRFVLYPGIEHKITNQMIEDLIKFFGDALQGKTALNK